MMKKFSGCAALRLAALASIALLILPGCRKKAIDDREMDDCEPYTGYFRGGEHYIEAEAVDEDGTVNRGYMLENRGPRRRPCAPGRKVLPSTRPLN